MGWIQITPVVYMGVYDRALNSLSVIQYAGVIDIAARITQYRLSERVPTVSSHDSAITHCDEG